MKNALLILAIAVLFMAANCYAGDIKLGVVDMENILKNSKRANSEKEKIKEDFDKLQSDLSEKEKALKKKRDEYEAQKALYSIETTKEKINELELEKEKLMKTLEQYQKSIKQSEQELIKKVFDEIREIIKKEDYQIVIEKNSGYVIYSAPEFEITDKMMDLYDNQKSE